MPVAIPRKECTRSNTNGGHFLGDHSDLENAMCKAKTGSYPSAFFDTQGYINCIITPEHTSTQKSILGRSMSDQRDHHQLDFQDSTDNVRAVVNIQITADSFIRTHVSIYDSAPAPANDIVSTKSISDVSFFSFDQGKFSPFESANAAKSITNTGSSRGQLMSDISNQSSPSQDGDRDEDEDDHKAASVLRTLYSVDPSVYSGTCEPLAHWIADHVWKVTTQGLSLPLAFIGSSPCTDLPAEPLPVLIESISSLLLSTLIQPSAIILSLFYVARLPAYIGTAPFHSLSSSSSAQRFNTLLLSSDSVAQEGPVVQALYASFKLFVLGAILSNKILDDHVFTMKTWHDVSGIPLRVLNELELLSLDILSHELHLDPSSWNQWIQTLYSHHRSMRGPTWLGNKAGGADGGCDGVKGESYRMVRYMLEGLMKVGEPGEKAEKDRSRRNSGSYSPSSGQYSNDNRHSYSNGNTNAGYSPLTPHSSFTSPALHPTPVFLGIQDRIASKLMDEKLQSEDLDGFEMDDDGPLREEYLPRRRSREAIAPFYQGQQPPSTYGTPNGHAYKAQGGQGQLYSSLPRPTDGNPSISRQSLAHRSVETHTTHAQALPPAQSVNGGSSHGPASFQASYAPSTTSLFAFPTTTSNSNHTAASTQYPSLQSFGLGLNNIDHTYSVGGAGTGLSSFNLNTNNSYLTHGIGHPRVGSTLCDYFLSYSRVRVY